VRFTLFAIEIVEEPRARERNEINEPDVSAAIVSTNTAAMFANLVLARFNLPARLIVREHREALSPRAFTPRKTESRRRRVRGGANGDETKTNLPCFRRIGIIPLLISHPSPRRPTTADDCSATVCSAVT